MKLFLRGLLVCAFATFSPLASAQSLWIGAAGDGNWGNAGNWNPFGVPVAGIATISSNVIITLPSANTTAQQINIEGFPVTFNASGSKFTTGTLLIESGGALNLNIPTGGIFVSTNNRGVDTSTFIGDGNGAGTLNLNGFGAMNFVSTNLSSAVGLGGTGVINQMGTTTLNATGAGFIIGADGNVSSPASVPNFGFFVQQGAAGGNGTYNLGGAAQLTVGTGFLLVGAGSGIGGGVTTGGFSATHGQLNITSTSATALTAGTVLVGTFAAPGGGTDHSTIATSGGINQSAGTATISTLLVVGDAPGATGLYQLSGGTLNTAAMTIGSQGAVVADEVNASSGSFQQTGGTVVINNTGGGASNLIIGDSGNGSYTISAGSLTLSGATGINFDIGNSVGGSGVMTQTGGTVTVGTSVPMLVGNAGNGTYNFSGGTLTVNSGINVGGGTGTGVFNYTGGTLLIPTGFISIGTGAGGGTFNFTGGNLDGLAITVGSAGNFNQGTDFTPTTTTPVTLTAGGSYTLSNGTLAIGGNTGAAASSGIDGTAGGNLNFAGGNLVTTSAFTDTLGGTITNGVGGVATSITTTGGAATLSGSLGGTGTLVLNLSATNGLTFSGTSVVGSSWGAQINNGTVTATPEALSSTGTYSIGNGATLLLNSLNATDTFGGTITGTGTASFVTGANDAAANTLVLSGTVNLGAATTTTIGNGGWGTLEVDNGTISNVNGANASATNTFVVGNGTSMGTVNLLGTNILPMVTVNAQSTLLAQNITGSVNSSGTLGSLGTSIAPGTLTLAGATSNLTSTGSILVHVLGATSDQYLANTATLSGQVTVSGFGALGTTKYTIVTAPGGITIGGDGMVNDPAGLYTSAPTALLASQLEPVSGGGTTLILDVVQKPIANYALTPNEASVGAALDNLRVGLPSAAATNFFTGLNNVPIGTAVKVFPVLLEQLSPQSLQYARNISFDNSTFMVQRVNNALANVRFGNDTLDTSGIGVYSPGFNSTLGRSMKSLLAFNPPSNHSAAPNGVNYYPNPAEDASSTSSSEASPTSSEDRTISDSPPQPFHSQAVAVRKSRFSEFVSGDIILADLNQSPGGSGNNPSSKATYTAGDALAGVSFRVNSNLSAGVLFDYNHTDAKTDSSGSKTKVDTYSPGIFATYAEKGFYVNGLFAFGYNMYQNTRNINLLPATATSSPKGETYLTSLDFGYDFHPFQQFTIGPTLGLTYTHLDIDPFTETGANPVDLSVKGQSYDSLRTRLGGRAEFMVQSGELLIAPNLSIMWQHEVLDQTQAITSTFNDPGFSTGGNITTRPAASGKDSALIGCGVTASMDTTMAFYLNYLTDVGADDYFAQSIIGGFKASF